MKFGFVLPFAVSVDALILQQQQGSAAPSIPSFDAFLQTKEHTYLADSAEYHQRRAYYEKRESEAAEQNSRRQRRWTAGVNELWDWSDEEFATLRGYRGRGASATAAGARSGHVALLQNATFTNATEVFPAEKHWKNLAATTQIRRQGGCGSCWAIAAVTVLQAHAELHAGLKRTFSAQQLVSCVPNPKQCGGAGGCKGATVELAMDWVMTNGIAEEHEVPYAAQDLACSAPKSTTILMHSGVNQRTNFGMTGWEKLPENKYAPLMRALVEQGPVAVSGSANGWAVYSKGIFDGCPLDAVVDHAITAVGFGVEGNDKYWTIQNSWGQHWGEQGYMRILRHDDDSDRCGINHQPELGTACIGGPTQVPVCGMCGILYDSVVPHF